VVKTDAPTVEEVAKAVGKLKNGKSAESAGITAELFKYSINSVVPALHRLFCRVWATGMVPAEWRDGIIVSLYKRERATFRVRQLQTHYPPFSARYGLH